MLLSLIELFDIVVMTLGVGFIFSSMFARHANARLDKESFKFACMVTAPALVLHELAHKFVALALGLHATFHASYTFLGLGILLKLVSFPFIFFVPGFVSISCGVPSCVVPPLTSALTAFAGPLMNLFLGVSAWLWLRYDVRLASRPVLEGVLTATMRINLLLFVLNMIPFGFFDGAKVFSGLIEYFF